MGFFLNCLLSSFLYLLIVKNNQAAACTEQMQIQGMWTKVTTKASINLLLYFTLKTRRCAYKRTLIQRLVYISLQNDVIVIVSWNF